MSNIGGRRCVATKKVKTANGFAHRCSRYEEIADVEHRGGSFGDLGNALNWNVGVEDVGVGALAGFAGVAGFRWLLNQDFAKQVPGYEYLVKAAPLLGGALAGGVLYFAQGGSSQSKGHAIGATAVGAALNGWDLLKAQFGAQLGLGDAWTYNLPYGYLTPEKSQGGRPGQYGGYAALIDDPRPGMAELAMASMGDEEEAAP